MSGARGAFSETGIELRRIIRFGLVGVSATLAYIVAAWSAAAALGIGTIAASFLGHLTSMLVSFFGHKYITYDARGHGHIHAARFLVVTAVAFGLNGATIWIMNGCLGLPYWWAILTVSVLVPVYNYFATRFWVFVPGLGR